MLTFLWTQKERYQNNKFCCFPVLHVLQNRNRERNEQQRFSTPVDPFRYCPEGRLQEHDMCHPCLTLPELIGHTQHESAFIFLHLLFMKETGNDVRWRNLMLMYRDGYPMHSALCKNSLGSTCISDFGQIISWQLGLTCFYYVKAEQYRTV